MYEMCKICVQICVHFFWLYFFHSATKRYQIALLNANTHESIKYATRQMLCKHCKYASTDEVGGAVRSFFTHLPMGAEVIDCFFENNG